MSKPDYLDVEIKKDENWRTQGESSKTKAQKAIESARQTLAEQAEKADPYRWA